jgi:RimJ/RimL family protein N-acetyltransferase
VGGPADPAPRGEREAVTDLAMKNVFLEGEKVYLRALEETDAETCYAWFSDPEVRIHLGIRAYPNTREGSAEFIRKIDFRSLQGFAIVLRADGAHIGNIALHDIDWVNRHAEVGIAIGRRDAWGKGYGREAIRLLARHAFRGLNLHRLFLRVTATNERAQRCYVAVGFKPEGRLREDAFIAGRYVDTIFMGMLRGEFIEA